MRCIGSLEAAEICKIFKENLHTSVEILQICMDLQDSVQRSLQNPAYLHRFAKIENLGSDVPYGQASRLLLDEESEATEPHKCGNVFK